MSHYLLKLAERTEKLEARIAELEGKRAVVKPYCPAHRTFHQFGGQDCPPCACEFSERWPYPENTTNCTIHGQVLEAK